MTKRMELEVKILDINKDELIKKLENLDATHIESTHQYLYTYDLHTLYSKYIDALYFLNNYKKPFELDTAIAKFKLVFFDIDNLLTNDDKSELKSITTYSNLTDILEDDKKISILNNPELIKFIEKFECNPKKWIRLRETNDKTTIAVKHVLAPNETDFEQMLETEIEVPSMEQANELLEALGFSYKSYQEKRRITYELDGFEIDIDSWPGIPTYLEIEGDNEEELDSILKKIGYSLEESISCNANEVYARYNKSMFDKRTLMFEDYENEEN